MERPMAPRKSRVEMVAPNKFLATGYSGAKVVLHNPVEGESREGPSPFESVILAAGGCTASDVVEILQKQREPIESFHIELNRSGPRGHPRSSKASTSRTSSRARRRR